MASSQFYDGILGQKMIEPISSGWVDRMMKIIPVSFVFSKLMFSSPGWDEVEGIFTGLVTTDNPEGYPEGYRLSDLSQDYRAFAASREFLFPYIAYCLEKGDLSSASDCMSFFNAYAKDVVSGAYLEDATSCLFSSIKESYHRFIISLIDEAAKKNIIDSVSWLGENARAEMTKFLS
jgi:hypothetical protein